MKNILDIQATASYIKACASQADLKVEYKDVKQAHVSGNSIVIPAMKSVATERDLIKLRSFVAETVASKLYSGTALQDAGITYEGDDALLANIYNSVEGTRVQRQAASKYLGDKKSLTAGHKVAMSDAMQALSDVPPDEMKGVAPLVAACAMSEVARSDFDAYGNINADELIKACPDATDLLYKARDAGLIDRVADVSSSEESLEVARAIKKLIEDEQEDDDEQGDDGEGESGSDGSDGSSSGAGKDAADALSEMMSAGSEIPEGSEPSGLSPEYVESYGGFTPCQKFEVINCYKGEAHGVSPEIDRSRVGASMAASRTLSTTVRKLFQVKAHKFYRGGLKSGKLHGRNLARAAFPSESYSQRVFRKKQENDTLDTAVSLLVDFSGSMRGSRINTACAGAGLLSNTLTTLGMPNEVIGFTEPFAVADPPCIQYVIKPFGLRMSEPAFLSSFEEASKRLSNNNDGDSLLWTYNRLKVRSEKRKILIVLSDGHPECGQRGAGQYLRDVIADINREGVVELVGIGIESHSVEDFYPTNFVVDDTEDLPDAILNTIKRKIL